MVDEERSAQDERLDEEAATTDAVDSGIDPSTEIIETLKALPIDTAQGVIAKILRELPHEEAKEVATSVVEALPEDAIKVKTDVATSAVHTLPEGAADAKTEIAKEAVYALPDDASEHKKEIATSAVEALPEGATKAKMEIAASVVDSLPDGAVAAKTEIATDAVHSLPDHATEAKKEIVKESVRELSPEFRDYLIADLVTMRRLFKRVFVWTVFGAAGVALVIAILTAVGRAFWGLEQIQHLLWVMVPVTTLLLGYGFGRTHSEQADIKYLREQNPERENGSKANSNRMSRASRRVPGDN